uniref:XK-related protein n=1 Tax=Oryzias latipes TaxID=8090 RepID=A0A3P9HFI9_ORYLA
MADFHIWKLESVGGAFEDSKLQTLSFLSSFSNSFKKNVRTPVPTHSGDTMAVFTFSPLDFVFSCLGLPLFLADVVLDVIAVVDFYKEEAWVRLSVLLLLLVGSSVLIQVYSWKWYIGDGLHLQTPCDVFLGSFRHLGVLEKSVSGFCGKGSDRQNSKDVAVELSHDLCMLHLIETFSESAPQIVLWLTIILQDGKLDTSDAFQEFSMEVLCSIAAVAFCVTTYHRSLRSFLKDTNQLSIISSIIHFLWNLLLLLSRLTALALFASVLPCFIFTHVFCSWMIFVLFAWRAQTNFMDDPWGERLYRATVALIWYFDWFNVFKKRTKKSALLYHSFILLDTCMLCGLWFWRMNTHPPQFVIPRPYAEVMACSVVAVYILGLVVKVLYYRFFHPTLNQDNLRGEDQNEVSGQNNDTRRERDETEGPMMMRMMLMFLTRLTLLMQLMLLKKLTLLM